MTKRQRNGIATLLGLIFVMQAFAHPPLFGCLVLAVIVALSSMDMISGEE